MAILVCRQAMFEMEMMSVSAIFVETANLIRIPIDYV